MTASRYTPEIADDILTRISEGTPLRQAARDIGMPESTIREWVRGDVEGFATKYKEARVLQIDSWADEVLLVAYDKGIEPADKRVITENLRWLLSKVAPSRFGERLLLAGDRDAPIHHLHEHQVQAALEGLSPSALQALEDFSRTLLAERGGRT